jgi:hypothetical protein
MDWHVASPRTMAMTKSIAVSKDLVSRNPSLSLHHHDHIVKQHASIQGLAPPHQHGRINCTLTQWICTTSPSTPSSHPHERRSKARTLLRTVPQAALKVSQTQSFLRKTPARTCNDVSRPSHSDPSTSFKLHSNLHLRASPSPFSKIRG